jgi:hypothetical protein
MIALKRLSIDNIESSPEIRNWLAQFSEDKQLIAKVLLSRLEFVPRDIYSNWVLETINRLDNETNYALYAVRKLGEDAVSLWDESGEVVGRPGTTLGSEDLVYSLITNASRLSHRFFDHPSIEELRCQKIHNLVLIDDSIGSGDRVSEFIAFLLNHKSLMSWWSYGLIRLHVIAFARTLESEKVIVSNLRGSDHQVRKVRKSTKITFESEKIYSKEFLESRWGQKTQEIVELCDAQIAVQKFARRGYGRVMGNLIFYHSVPNNTPGLVWFSNSKWKALFPERALPDWFHKLLETPKDSSSAFSQSTVSKEFIELMLIVKQGIRNISSIALRLGCDHKYASAMMKTAQSSGFLTNNYRLTKTGYELLVNLQKQKDTIDWNRSMYYPSSWCADTASVQPPSQEEFTRF